MPNLPAPEMPVDGRFAFALGSTVLAEMRRFGVPPIPCYYELWFNYRTGQHQELSVRMGKLLAEKRGVDRADLDAMIAEFSSAAETMESASATADELHEAAEALSEQVSKGHEAVKRYGDALERGARHLSQSRTIESLVDAVTFLTAETIEAGERNRVLERQLTASTARIGKLRQSLTDVRQEASTDSLTGVANRRAFDIKLRRAIGQARTDGAVLSVLMLDVDNFKSFNDSFGHKAGDLVLRMVGRLLTENVKGRDTVARYGGEEFAILLSGADCSAAVRVGSDIVEKLSRKRLVGKASGLDLGRVTASVGVAQARSDDDAAALVERADAALYEAKRLGRNQVCRELEASREVVRACSGGR